MNYHKVLLESLGDIEGLGSTPAHNTRLGRCVVKRKHSACLLTTTQIEQDTRTPMGFTDAQRQRLIQWLTGHSSRTSTRTQPDGSKGKVNQNKSPEQEKGGVGRGVGGGLRTSI